MTTPLRTRAPRQCGFTLIELMVTLTIVGIGLALAVPYFGGATTSARERRVVSQLLQDFDWARSAAGATDASMLGVPGATGSPVIVMTITSNPGSICSWSVTVNGTPDLSHTMTQTQTTSQAPNLTCTTGATNMSGAANLALPAKFKFLPSGFVDNTGTITFIGSAARWPLQFLLSGSVVNLQAAT